MKIISSGVFDTGDNNLVGKIKNQTFSFYKGTVFGVVLYSKAIINGREVGCEEYFCRVAPITIQTDGEVAVFVCLNWSGKNIFAGQINTYGDVSYIDGCTDSLLVCPPRLGDPCLNALFFPKNTIQSFHTHPSQRLGVVLSGSGYASLNDEEIKLEKGSVFVICTGEKHRFKTDNIPMVVVAYHPDSDWGPTDETHPMINRTIL